MLNNDVIPLAISVRAAASFEASCNFTSVFIISCFSVVLAANNVTYIYKEFNERIDTDFLPIRLPSCCPNSHHLAIFYRRAVCISLHCRLLSIVPSTCDDSFVDSTVVLLTSFGAVRACITK